MEFLRRTINDLIRQRGFSLETLARGRFILEKALRRKIMDYRQRACLRGHQRALFGGKVQVETSYTYAFNFDPNQYPAHWHYSGGCQFSKHYYPAVGELESKGEEFECAQAIDRCSLVKHWMRNIANQPAFSFRLPLADGYFYPDSVAELKDGRILVVEYKGAHLVEGAQEKLNIGQLWEQKSNGRGLFLMAVKEDEWGRDVYRQIEDKVSTK